MKLPTAGAPLLALDLLFFPDILIVVMGWMLRTARKLRKGQVKQEQAGTEPYCDKQDINEISKRYGGNQNSNSKPSTRVNNHATLPHKRTIRQKYCENACKLGSHTLGGWAQNKKQAASQQATTRRILTQLSHKFFVNCSVCCHSCLISVSICT